MGPAGDPDDSALEEQQKEEAKLKAQQAEEEKKAEQQRMESARARFAGGTGSLTSQPKKTSLLGGS